jgi:glycosyltransferase involved in cell wall biosynthesis
MMNEEDNIPLLITSVRSQITDTPVALVAADNNSTDRSVAHVKEMGGNVVHAPKQGIGPARQKALEYIQRHTTVPERTILIQTDADCVMDRLDYISSVATAFQDNPAVMVGVGPGTYAVPFEDGSTIELASARDYAQLLGTTGMAGYIKALGKDPRDYLLEEPYRYLIGPNTTYRMSLFRDYPIHYPDDQRWESLDISIRTQRHIGGSSIQYVDGQRMRISSRAITAEEPYLTQDRLQDIRDRGFVEVFTEGKTVVDPLTTVAMVLSELGPMNR